MLKNRKAQIGLIALVAVIILITSRSPGPLPG